MYLKREYKNVIQLWLEKVQEIFNANGKEILNRYIYIS